MKSLGNCDLEHLNERTFESQSHTGALLAGLNALLKNGLLLDVTLVAGGQEFKVHRVVLAACSEYFRAMFTDALKESRQQEICLKGVSAKGMHYLLDYIYTSRLPINLANIQDILATANHIQLFPVVEACSHYLQEQLDLDNCVDIATISETYSLHALRKRVYQFMCSALSHLCRLPDFQRLSGTQLEYLLRCDFPVDCDETEVLRALTTWCEFEPERMVLCAPQLMAAVHFEEIPAEHVAQFVDSQVFKNIFSCTMPVQLFEHKPLQRCFQTWASTTNACSASAATATATTVALRSGSGSSTRALSDLAISGLSSSSSASTTSSPASLLNSRGMEMALVKVGGFGLGGITNQITYLLPSVGKWCHLTTIPHVAQCNYGTAVLRNELYVIGGSFNQSLQNIHPFGFRFFPRDHRWSTIAPMQQERCRFSLCAVNGELYAVGGETGEEGLAAGLEVDISPCEKYDPDADLWLLISPLPGRRSQHAGAPWNNFLFVSGGLDHESVLSSVARYDTVRDFWESRAPLLLPRADHCMTSDGDRLYVCGGWHEDETNGNRVIADTVDVYDIETDTWRVLTRMPTPRYHAGAVVIGEALYVVGGFHSDVTFDRATGVIECYSFARNAWTTVQAYPQDIWEHCCTTLYIPRCRDHMEVVSDVTS